MGSDMLTSSPEWNLNTASQSSPFCSKLKAAVDTAARYTDGMHVTARTDARAAVSLKESLERARMERVFLNLISNAIAAMPKGGRIDISAARGRDGILIAVDDTGPGIPEDIHPHLFEPFVTSKSTGSGLGLALVAKIIGDHGGEALHELTAREAPRFEGGDKRVDGGHG